MTVIVLGLGFTDHEASAALVVDGRLTAAIARERLTRLKSDGKLWGSRSLDLSSAIRYCMDAAGADLSDVDLVVWSHIDHCGAAAVLAQLAREGSLDLSTVPRLTIPHHFAHACCAFYLSPFPEAAILVADGAGGPLGDLRRHCTGPERDALAAGTVIVQNLRTDQGETAREHESFYHCDGARWETLRKIVGQWGGIGAEYGAVTELLFGDCLHAGKTMGLAPYGTTFGRSLFLKAIGPDDLMAFRSDHSPERDELEGQLRMRRQSSSVPHHLEPLATAFAASVQSEAEEALVAHARWLRSCTGSRNLCVAGGVALNCVANSRLATDAGFDAIFVPPAPGDDGIAVGCALYGAAYHRRLVRDGCSVFLGRAHRHSAADLATLGLAAVQPPRGTCDYIARRIADGAVVAWYQAGAEIGPRALGHRSLLADPRDDRMQDHLNRVVKRREIFRPFAPVVLEGAVLDYFEEDHPSYFMSFVARVRPAARQTLPAVTHVDGTARYQVLRERDNPELYELVRTFARMTGVPVLLNTSLNRAGEPIVETPLEAARCAVESSVDCVVVDGVVYESRRAGD